MPRCWPKQGLFWPTKLRGCEMPATSKLALVTSNFATPAAVHSAMLTKLEESALTASDARRLQLECYTAQQVQTELKTLTFHRAGFKIPYFSAAGKRNHFFRFRYLEYDNARGFARLVHANGKPNKHDVRYLQPTNTLPRLYTPP